MTGLLVTPAALAVTLAVPVRGTPDALFPLQATNVESHTPAQTRPAGETVTRLGLVELKVKVVATVVAAELTAETESCVTCPATREMVAGDKLTTATVLLFDELPPQPAMSMAAASTASRLPATDHRILLRRLFIGGKTMSQSSD